MYHKRKWLNKKGIYATSSITAFHGINAYLGDDDKRIQFIDKKLTISDCHNSICIHQMVDQTNEEYITKIRTISKVASDFADYLESEITKQTKTAISDTEDDTRC